MKQIKEDQLIAEKYSNVIKENRKLPVIDGKEVEDFEIERDHEQLMLIGATFVDGTELDQDQLAQLEKEYGAWLYNKFMFGGG